MSDSAQSLTTQWHITDAIDFCRMLEPICPEFGCHIALTGGCLYKKGFRKDLDIIIYRIRQSDFINWDGLLGKMGEMGIMQLSDAGNWCFKAEYEGKKIDFLCPEEIGNEEDYPGEKGDGQPDE